MPDRHGAPVDVNHAEGGWPPWSSSRAATAEAASAAPMRGPDDQGETPLEAAMRSRVKDRKGLAAVVGLLTEAGAGDRG